MIKDEIVKWVKEQSYWLQVSANSIFRGEKLNDESLDKIYVLFKKEFGLLQEPLKKDNLDFLAFEDANENHTKMNWNSISKIQGVNALKEGESINIGKQVTLVYGENGSGKSGYTRLLNNAFISRGDKTILPNVFKKTGAKPSAIFDFKDDEDNIISMQFPENRNNSLFNSVSVFDTASAVHDLTKETELAFVPMELNFFDEVTQVFLSIKSKLDAEIESKQQTNEFENYFDKNTSIKKFVQKINGQTNYAEIKSIADTSELDEIYEEKVKRKIVLQSLNINEKLKEYNKLKQELNNIKEKVLLLNNKYSSESIMKTEGLLTERTTLKELSSNESIAQLEGEQIYRLGSSEWKKFILAAEEYHNSIDEEIEECLFCGQNIEKITVIDKYWKYLKSTAEKNLVMGESNIKKIKADFDSQEFGLIVEGSRTEEWLKENQIDLYDQLITAEKEFMNVNSDIVENLSELEWNKVIEPYNVNISCFDNVFELLDINEQQLEADKVKKEISSIESFINEYNDKLKLEKLLPKIESFINSMKWVDSARMINLSTQKITTFQKNCFLNM
ncbi:AAA family ATPase [Listeria ivanovii]|uniref:AAA family ATPase n=1 Tax=Listeria ivanovii TaxID=1638 RepID=UPI0019431B10|nr:AAA family ATPase [Listeria ivanovii]